MIALGQRLNEMRRMGMRRGTSRELIQLNTSSACKLSFHSFVGNEQRRGKKRAKTCFEEKRSLEEFHESNVHFFSPSSFARILFRRFCRRQLSTALFSRARPLKYHFLLSPNKTISCCLPRADTRTATPSMIGAERECNLILIALLQDKNKTHERETKPGTNNENDVYFGFHLMCNWKLVEQCRMNGALCSSRSDATGSVVFLFLEMIRSIYKPRWRRKTQIIIILVLTFFAF